MKKVVYLLFVCCLLVACAGDEPVEETQDYTSFTILLDDNLRQAKTGYYDSNGDCILIKDHGNIVAHVETEEVILPVFHNEIYLFFDHSGDSGYRMKDPFILKKNIKNKLHIPENSTSIMINTYLHPNQWPN